MHFIGNTEEIKKDVFANLIYNKLNTIIQDEDAILYYQYPFYKGDIKSDIIEAKLLLVSSIYGLFFFEIDKNDHFTEDTKNQIDILYNEIASRMLKHMALRIRRNQLKYELVSVVVGNYQDYNNTTQEEYILCKIDDIATVIEKHKLEVPISQEVKMLIESCIDGTSTLIQKKERLNVGPKTKARILNEIQSHIANFDIEQKRIAEIDIDLPQRIRGLAGSGKTIVLAYKAARFHAQYPDKRILYTFYTKSLAATVKNLINRAFKNYSNNEPNWEMIKVCHGWGSASSEGVYYNTCIHNGYPTMTFAEARKHSDDAFAYICKVLCAKDIEKEYDLILIDEGQDFPSDFYRLCYKLCKTKRICWAYDDFQNIFDVEIQNEQDTFGTDEHGKPYIDFGVGNGLQDQVLKKCYRTPRYSLIYAFALGLGIYNDKVLQRLESNKQWESLGFKVEEGDSATGSKMIISRPEENTPAYSNKEFTEDSIKKYKFISVEKECEYISKEIARCIQEQGLLPTDICVICIDSQRIGDYFTKISKELRQYGISPFNLLNAPYNNISFFIEGSVTLSSVNKAKGNECGVVFICGIDSVFKNPNNVVMRDKLFTSMTRTKGWLYLSGCGDKMDSFFKELKKIEENNYKLEFIQPDKAETKNIENVSRVTDAAEHYIYEQIRKLKESGLKTEDIQKIIHDLLFSTK